MDVSRARVMAYRVARQGLGRDGGEVVGLRVLDLGVQEVVAGSHRVALAARLPPGAALEHSGLAMVWAQRGAPHLLRRAEVAAHAARLYPRGDADAAARLGTPAARSLRAAGIGPLEAFARGAAALRAVVSREMPRAVASAGMTAALAAAFSYDCAPCGSRHVFGSLFQLVGAAAGVEVLGGRPARLAPLPRRHALTGAASGDVVADYLAVHGPAGPGEVASYLGTSRSVVAAMWPGGLVEVRVDGRAGWLLEAQVEALVEAPEPVGVRLLPAMDPLLQGRDREVLVPDAGRRSRVWRVIGSPGAVLVDGEFAGVWRPKVSGRRLELAVAMFAPVGARLRGRVEAEAEVVAAARGLSGVRVGFEEG